MSDLQEKVLYPIRSIKGDIYARYSPGRERDQTSTIEAQVAMCREQAQRSEIIGDLIPAQPPLRN